MFHDIFIWFWMVQPPSRLWTLTLFLSQIFALLLCLSPHFKHRKLLKFLWKVVVSKYWCLVSYPDCSNQQSLSLEGCNFAMLLGLGAASRCTVAVLMRSTRAAGLAFSNTTAPNSSGHLEFWRDVTWRLRADICTYSTRQQQKGWLAGATPRVAGHVLRWRIEWLCGSSPTFHPFTRKRSSPFQDAGGKSANVQRKMQLLSRLSAPRKEQGGCGARAEKDSDSNF